MAAIEGTGVTYEDLAEMEKQFDDAETEISKLRPEKKRWKSMREARGCSTTAIESLKIAASSRCNT